MTTLKPRIELPHGYISYSQYDLWKRSPETYRKKYYGGQRYGSTPAMAFGNEVTEAMERNEEWVAFIPRLPEFEREMFVNFDIHNEYEGGVNAKIFIDNTDRKTNEFYEQKTGKTPWTQNKVNKHTQLDMYSTGLEIEDGFVHDECSLIWVKTRNVEGTIEFAGMTLEGGSQRIELTGEYEVIKRVITKEEREAFRKDVIRVAREISEDWAAMKKFYE